MLDLECAQKIIVLSICAAIIENKLFDGYRTPDKATVVNVEFGFLLSGSSPSIRPLVFEHGHLLWLLR